MPSAPKKPIQNWCVDHRLRTRGMPTRSSARGFDSGSGEDFGAAEGGFANHFRSIWVCIPGALHIFLYDPHFVGVFQQSLRTGVAADDALPAGAERNLAPRAALAIRQTHVDERALAAHGAPGARCVLIR